MTKPTGRRLPGRPYCEAFPMLDVHDVLRAAGEGRVYQVFSDEDGLVVGHASVQELTADSVTISHRFYGTRNVESGAGVMLVAIRRSKGGKYWHKPSFVCAQCGRDVTRLYWVRGSWSCKQSHNLLGITQRLDPVKKATYLKEVHERSLREQSGTQEELHKLEKRKPKYGAAILLLANSYHAGELPWHLQFRTFGRWLEPGKVPPKQNKRDPGYGWAPGMRGQLPGLGPVRPGLEHEPPAPQKRARVRPQPTKVDSPQPWFGHQRREPTPLDRMLDDIFANMDPFAIPPLKIF